MNTPESVQRPVNFSSLISKLDEMNISLSNDALIEKKRDVGRATYIPLKDFLIFGYESDDFYYLDAIINDKQWDRFITQTYNKQNISEYEINHSFESAYLDALNHSEYEFGDIDKIMTKDNQVFLYADNIKVATITKLKDNDFTLFEPTLAKRFEKAMKGLTTGNANTFIEKKFKQFKGLSKLKVDLSYNGDKSGKITHWDTNNLFMPKLNNYVLQMKNIINVFAIEPITLSQAKELVMAYFDINNWHIALKNEKKNDYFTYIINAYCANSYKILDTVYTKNFSEAMIAMDSLVIRYPDNYKISNSGVAKGFYLSGDKTLIEMKTEVIGLDVVDFNDANIFNQSSELLPLLKEIKDSFALDSHIKDTSFKKTAHNISKLPHGMPMLYEKEIEGELFYLTINIHHGLSITKKVLTRGYLMTEIGNATIQENAKNELCVLRDCRDERVNLSGLSHHGVKELAKCFGLAGESAQYNQEDEFIISPAAQAFSQWAEKNLSSFDFPYGTKNFEINLESLN